MKKLLILLLPLFTVACGGESFSVDGADQETPQPVEPTEPTQPSQNFPILTNASGIIWKPTSEGDGRLVILLPSSASCVSVFVGAEQGAFSGRTNPNKCTYRFTRQGGGYPRNVTLTVGANKYTVANPAARIN